MGTTVKCETFTSATKSWPVLTAEAAEFATSIGKERLMNIIVTADNGVGTVFVWYWE